MAEASRGQRPTQLLQLRRCLRPVKLSMPSRLQQRGAAATVRLRRPRTQFRRLMPSYALLGTKFVGLQPRRPRSQDLVKAVGKGQQACCWPLMQRVADWRILQVM
jgi:hypothetical protein